MNVKTSTKGGRCGVPGVVIGDIEDRKHFCFALCLTFPLVGRLPFTDFSFLELFIMAKKVEGLILVETWILTGGSAPDKEEEVKRARRIFDLEDYSFSCRGDHIYITAYLIWCHQLKFLSDVEGLKLFSNTTVRALILNVDDIIRGVKGD